MRSIEATNRTFAKLVRQPGTVLVQFYMHGCAPCRAVKPLVAKLAAERGLTLIRANAMLLPIAARGISVVPAFRIYASGKLVDQIEDPGPKLLGNWIDTALQRAAR